MAEMTNEVVSKDAEPLEVGDLFEMAIYSPDDGAADDGLGQPSRKRWA
jgi:hypothetical protein